MSTSQSVLNTATELNNELDTLKLKAKMWGLNHYITQYKNKEYYKPEFAVNGLSIEELSKIKLTTEQLKEEIQHLNLHMGLLGFDSYHNGMANDLADRAVGYAISEFQKRPDWIAMNNAEMEAKAARMEARKREAEAEMKEKAKRAEEERAEAARAAEANKAAEKERAASAERTREVMRERDRQKEQLRVSLMKSDTHNTIGIVTPDQLEALFNKEKIITAEEFKRKARKHFKLEPESVLTNQHLIEYYKELTKPTQRSVFRFPFNPFNPFNSSRSSGGKRRTKRRQNKSGKKSKKNKKRQRKGAKKSNKRPKRKH